MTLMQSSSSSNGGTVPFTKMPMPAATGEGKRCAKPWHYLNGCTQGTTLIHTKGGPSPLHLCMQKATPKEEMDLMLE